MSHYDEVFYRTHSRGVRDSAGVIVPLIISLVQPRSVIDVGCGTGTWLAQFVECGIADYLGIDGNWVDRASLEIPVDHFTACDLTKALAVKREFDLAICLEVAEHLPCESAAGFIQSLTKLAPIVAFSAAIPLQGGTGHQNESWQAEWSEHFASNDYLPLDALRPRIWSDERVAFWYAQNLILYVRRDLFQQKWEVWFREQVPPVLSVVHPKLFLMRAPQTFRLKKVLAMVPRAISAAVKRWCGSRPVLPSKEHRW
jgi:SAM-dependent methyltransferase